MAHHWLYASNIILSSLHAQALRSWFEALYRPTCRLAFAPEGKRNGRDPKAGDPVRDAEVFVQGGRKATGRRVVEWAREAEARGAGEILLTSMDADGTRAGFDCELTAAVSDAVKIPVIASGGAGTVAHFADVFARGKADAALAASIFHFGVSSARALKEELVAAGVPVRLPC